MDDAVLSDVEMNAFSFSDAPAARPVRARKSKSVIVESEVRCSASLSALCDGFKDSSPAKPTSLKKPAAKPPKKRKVQANDQQPHVDHHDEAQAIVPPPTPIDVLQRVGLHLGIASEKLTKEKLNATSCKSTFASSSSDDS